MKTVIVYDSMFGNTQKVAEAVASKIGGECVLCHVKEAKPQEVQAAGLLIVGSPTHGGRASIPTQTFLKQLSKGILANVQVAAFDTRIAAADQSWWLKLVMKLIDFAAPKMAKGLAGKGGRLLLEPEGFIVNDKEGPLREGELERAQSWGEKINNLLLQKQEGN
ncbi:flavodoxin family protein [Candidatus Falkowbacteria bacterium]|nr:flavodoxin family protein [Candidatus Falkowbacteria bacterium]